MAKEIEGDFVLGKSRKPRKYSSPFGVSEEVGHVFRFVDCKMWTVRCGPEPPLRVKLILRRVMSPIVSSIQH
ncbi:hypothetical protein WN943_016149 [Citrus x changshan-huyou]